MNLNNIPQQITHIKQPSFQQFRFEYHAGAQTVYLIRVGMLTDDGKEIGDPISMHIKDEGSAINAVQTWLRGYKTGVSEHAVKNAKAAA